MWWWLGLALAGGEMPYDGIDQDGDGHDLVDVDGDGYASVLVGGGDCNDRSAAVNPAARDRRRDGVDDDCDGSTDEGYVGLGEACSVGVFGHRRDLGTRRSSGPSRPPSRPRSASW